MDEQWKDLTFTTDTMQEVLVNWYNNAHVHNSRNYVWNYITGLVHDINDGTFTFAVEYYDGCYEVKLKSFIASE